MRDEYDFSNGVRGSVVPMPPGMQRVTIHLDKEILEFFYDQCRRAGGGNYQEMINDILRDHIRREREPLEETLRRTVAGYHVPPADL